MENYTNSLVIKEVKIKMGSNLMDQISIFRVSYVTLT